MFYKIKIGITFCVLYFLLLAGRVEAAGRIETALYNILEKVYQGHPQLLAERALRDKDNEQIKQAKTGWRPDISAQGSASSSLTEPGSFGISSGETANLGLIVTQPLYRGGRTVSKTHETKLLFQAQKARVRSITQSILLDAISAYIALVRDGQLVGLREKNFAHLQEQLDFEQARYELGENTVTDLSQAKARLAESEAGLVKSKGQLSNTIARYERVVGMPPPDMEDVALPVLDLQKNLSAFTALEQILVAGYQNHPDIVEADLQARANKATQKTIKGELYPSLSLVGETQRIFRPTFAQSEAYQDQSRISVQANISLYASGSTRSRLKQSRHDGNRLLMTLIDTKRVVQENITISWQNLQVDLAENRSRLSQVDASKVALEGTKAEFHLGGRTTLDVLDAEEEKLDADVALVTAKHDVVLAEFNLLMAAGQLNLKNLSTLLVKTQ